MLNVKNIFPKNVNNILSIFVTPLISLRIKPKSYFAPYLTNIFSDLLSKSSVIKDCPENTINNNNTTSNFINFYYYLNIPYYPCICLYKSLSPLSFDKFLLFVYSLYFGNIESLLKLTFNFLSNGNKTQINKSEVLKILNHFYLNSSENYALFDNQLNNLEEIVNKCITADQLNYNQWKNISTEVNCDVFILLLFYIAKSCEILNVENLNLLQKINSKSSKISNKNISLSNNSATQTATNLFVEFEHLNSKDTIKMSIDITQLLFNFLCQTHNLNMEYIDPDDLNASYNSDMEVLDAFDKDKEDIFNKLYELTTENTSKKNDKNFANMTLAGENNVVELKGFNDTIVGGGLNLKMQTLGGDELQNQLLNKLKMPGIKNMISNQNKNNNINFNNVSKYEGFIYLNKKLCKIKFYLINKDLFIVDEYSVLLFIINLTSNNINSKIISYKDNEKIKENKYLHLKLYGNNNFYFNDKDKNQAKDFIKLLYQKLNLSISTHNDNYNSLSNLNGKYVADESKEIIKFNQNNFLKIFKINEGTDVNYIFKNKKELYLKMIYNKNNNPLKEHYVFEILKKLSLYLKENCEIGIKMHDKYENSLALYLIYSIHYNSNFTKGISFSTLKGQIYYIRSIANLIFHLHKLGLCLNCTFIDINIKSPIDFLANYFLSDDNIIFCDYNEKIEHKKRFGYCPPEVLNGESSNNNIDLWFLGNLMYFTLFRKLPFYDEGSNLGDNHIYTCIFNREITFDNASTKINSSSDGEDNITELYELIVKCLNVDYNKRGNSNEALYLLNKIIQKYQK